LNSNNRLPAVFGFSDCFFIFKKHGGLRLAFFFAMFAIHNERQMLMFQKSNNSHADFAKKKQA
jgi:hypothetical protein